TTHNLIRENSSRVPQIPVFASHPAHAFSPSHSPLLTSVCSMSEELPILRPKPRRPFELPTDTPSGTNTPSTPTDAYGTDDSPFNSPTALSSSSRSKSAVALNASTLSGIYPQELMDEQPTPL